MAFQEILPPAKPGTGEPDEIRVGVQAVGKHGGKVMKIRIGVAVLREAGYGSDDPIKVEWDMAVRKIRLSKPQTGLGWKLRPPRGKGYVHTLHLSRFPEGLVPADVTSRKVHHQVLKASEIRPPYSIVITLPKDFKAEDDEC